MDNSSNSEITISPSSTPFYFSKLLYRHPILIQIISWSIGFICLIIIAATGTFEFAKSTDRDYMVWSDYRIRRNDAWSLANDNAQESYLEQIFPGEEGVPDRAINEIDNMLFIMFEATGGHELFTVQNIQKMQEVEDYFQTFSNNKYRNYCLATSPTNSECLSNSLYLIGHLFPTTNLNDQLIEQTLYALSQPAYYESSKVFFGTEFTQAKPRASVQSARSMFAFGLPLRIDGIKYKSRVDRHADQITKTGDFQYEFYKYLENKQEKHFKIYVYSGPLWDAYFNDLIMKDCNSLGYWFVLLCTLLYDFSYKVSFLIIYLTIRSAILPLVGMMQVLLAFPITFFIYRIIFQINFFQQLHVVVIFLILGIAAGFTSIYQIYKDDIFVYTDAWNQSKMYERLQNNMEERIAYTYRRAATSMLATTCNYLQFQIILIATTMFSFVATAISEVFIYLKFNNQDNADLLIWNICSLSDVSKLFTCHNFISSNTNQH